MIDHADIDGDKKTATIRQLRREVGYGCPICRNPFLTWHHFDPPFHEEKHWRPEGMIALCLQHHAAADSKGGRPGAYTVQQLRELKNANYSSQDVKGSFPVLQIQKKMLIRVGGVYTDKSSPIISINGEPQISISVGDEDMLNLSFELRNKDDHVLLKMENNWLTAYPNHLHDMTAEPKTNDVTVWLGKRDVGLKFSFKWIAMEELEGMLESDSRRASAAALRSLGGIGSLEGTGSDRLGDRIKQWARENVISDGLVPLLNFHEMSLYYRGRKALIKDGIADSIYYSFLHDLVGGCVDIRM